MDLRLENVKEIPSPSTPPEEQRECRLAKYNDQNDQNDQIVLLDPKDWGQNPDDPRGNKVYERFKELAQKLSTVRHEDCQTLHCKGWFQDQVKRQFYLVYEPPSSCQAPTKYATLHELFESTFKPSLTDRFILARKIARTVRRLHEEELLHKGIRSKNVIFFPTRTGASRSIDDPWLVGFDFARRDSDGQYSEKDIKMSTHASLYRHPDALRDNSIAFTRLHDYYSLGVLLAEIALWQPIEQILKRHTELQYKTVSESDARKVRGILLDNNSEDNHPREIAFRAGKIYRNVVNICLSGDFKDKSRAGLLKGFEDDVVNQLGRCVT